MIPKRIELENFLSFGKPAVEFTFGGDEPLWVLCGKNGVGKSAVFDGITYALYGEHRGGSQKAEQLIRHGANGFRVVLEFEFAGTEYRITRGRAGRTVQKVERRVEDEWEAIPGMNSAAEVKEWVETTLGLKFKAFTTSVLLRQGEADRLFSAGRDERIAVLKGIIGFEHFEDISERIHSATSVKRNSLDTLRGRIDALAPVTPEELKDAESAVKDAALKREEAQAALAAAVQRVEQAKQWEGLETKRNDLEQKLAEAGKRAADAETIRADKARLDELATAVPELESLVGLRDKLAVLGPKLTAAESTRDQTTAAIDAKAKAVDEARQKATFHKEQSEAFDRQAKTLIEEVERGERFLELADAIMALKAKLAGYPADLADQVARAEAEEKVTSEEKHKRASDLAIAEALLGQARDLRDRFANVEVGGICSRCLQPVGEEHAAKERAQMAKEVQDREAEVERLCDTVKASEAAYLTTSKRRIRLQKDKTEFDNHTTEFVATTTSLTQLGGVADAAELRARLAEQGKEKRRAEQCAAEERTKQAEDTKEANRLDEERKRLGDKLMTATDTVRALELERAAARADYNSGLARLASDWQSRIPTLDVEGVRKLGAERDRLRTSGVATRFESLQQDEEKRSEWLKRLAEVRSDIDRIPSDAWIPAQGASRFQGEARDAAVKANDARDAAVRVRDELKSRVEEHERLTTQLRVTEREHDVHKKLDDLLGQNGLQRELVRDAEQQIVALANDTLQNLSDGDLFLEQDDEAAGRDDKAFALRVRQAGDPLPIGVLFLSGSQKFRVAVSVALAVGRFAFGRAKPLEAVIIDEGFGSLDKDGLRVMAEELKRLQQSQSLKRVILVSHQDEFTDQFPVGYRLCPGDQGTTAAPFRR